MDPWTQGRLARDRMDELLRESGQGRLARVARRRDRGSVSAGRHGEGPATAGRHDRWSITTRTREADMGSVTQGRDRSAGHLGAARRRLVGETLAIYTTVVGFGILYGMTARAAGFSLLDLEAMNLLVFAGGSQLVAIGLLAAGLPWVAIVAVTAVINLRHLLYGATLAPWFAGRPLLARATAAYVVVDESFALSLAHFRRVGRFDGGGYSLVAVMLIGAWLISTGIGWAAGSAVPAAFETTLRVLVPASMAGMAVLLVTDRQTLLAAAGGAAVAAGAWALVGPVLGILAGGIAGPLVAVAAGAVGRAAMTSPAILGPATGLGSAEAGRGMKASEPERADHGTGARRSAEAGHGMKVSEPDRAQSRSVSRRSASRRRADAGAA